LKLKPYSYKNVIKILSNLGFAVIRQRGSHIILKGSYKNKKRTVVVPKHKEIAIGTLRAFCFKQDLQQRSFLNWLKKVRPLFQ